MCYVFFVKTVHLAKLCLNPMRIRNWGYIMAMRSSHQASQNGDTTTESAKQAKEASPTIETQSIAAGVKKARSFSEKKNGRSLLFIFLDWFAIFALIFISEYFWHPVLYLGILWLIGGRMIALAEVFGHDSVHYNLFEKRSWNYQLQFLWFFPVFETWDRYREEHFLHHSKLLTPEDPAYIDYKRWGLFEKKNNYVWIWFIRPFLLFDTPYIIKNTMQCLIRDKKFRRQLLPFWAIVLSVCYATGTLQHLLLYWFIPMLWCYPALLFWSETGEHFRAGDAEHPEEKTRSTYGILESLFISPHNDRFHYVHHRYPMIPWFQLKKATAALVPESPKSDGFMDLFYQVKDEKRESHATKDDKKNPMASSKDSTKKKPILNATSSRKVATEKLP